MKIKLTLFALSIALMSNAQSLNEDDWLHFATGAVISGTTYAIVYGKTKNKSKAFWYSLGLSTLAGLTKEVLDEHAFDGYFDGSEFAATIAGGLVVSTSFSIFTGKKKKKQKEKLASLRYKPVNNILSR